MERVFKMLRLKTTTYTCTLILSDLLSLSLLKKKYLYWLRSGLLVREVISKYYHYVIRYR